MEQEEDRFIRARRERSAYVDAIVKSHSRRKIVVAGPGTGKTFLFKEVLKGKQKSLTLTFVNSLVEDLSLELCGLSEVKTLHGFARSIMAGVLGRVKIFPKLSRVIAEDAAFLKGERIEFDSLLNSRLDGDANIPFYKGRRLLYQHYGFTDLIYAAVLYLEIKSGQIPVYDQVLVDEFQDFNKLEVSLIELLASKSPILIAGDDDQSLYYFKQASPDHIRGRYQDQNAYERFTLPYCSRCTRVIVDAVNDVIVGAKKEGFLRGRIDKSYLYFDDEHKERDSARHPKITHVKCFVPQIPFFIENEVRKIAEECREKFSVLVIAPTKTRCKSIAAGLRRKGFLNVVYAGGDKDDEPSLVDCLSLLSDDKKSHLGWRIACRLFLSEEEFKSVLAKADKTEENGFAALAGKETRATVRSLLASYRKVLKNQTQNPERLQELVRSLGFDFHGLAGEALQAKILARLPMERGDPATRSIPIKITTVPSSKGLAEDYVFITDFDDRFFLERDRRCSDQKVFDFLVALTRARRKVFLISADRATPKFLTWIEKGRIESIEV